MHAHLLSIDPNLVECHEKLQLLKPLEIKYIISDELYYVASVYAFTIFASLNRQIHKDGTGVTTNSFSLEGQVFLYQHIWS